MSQTLLLDVAYMLEATEHFALGGIVTAKPNGMVWRGDEIASNMAMVTLTVDFATAVQVSQNLLGFKVNDINAPTMAVPV